MVERGKVGVKQKNNFIVENCFIKAKCNCFVLKKDWPKCANQKDSSNQSFVLRQAQKFCTSFPGSLFFLFFWAKEIKRPSSGLVLCLPEFGRFQKLNLREGWMGELLSQLSVLVRGNFQLSDFHELLSVLPWSCWDNWKPRGKCITKLNCKFMLLLAL